MKKEGQSSVVSSQLPPDLDLLDSRVVAKYGIAKPFLISPRVARCPECDGPLEAQFSYVALRGLKTFGAASFEEPDLDGLILDCQWENESDEVSHRNWQSDWEPIFNTVKNYLRHTCLRLPARARVLK